MPLGVARLDVELKALALEGGLERFLVVGHLGRVVCVVMDGCVVLLPVAG